jgi:hypothetical protein
VITITGIGDQLRPEWPITFTGMRIQGNVALLARTGPARFDSLTKTARYSGHPFQILQLAPMLARFTAEPRRLRLDAGGVLLPLLLPLRAAEESAIFGDLQPS